MLARYDLDYEHPTFDFFGWGVMAVAAGATAIVVNKDIPSGEKTERFKSIIVPGAEILGLPLVQGDGGDRLLEPGFQRWKLRNLIAWVRAGNKFKRLAARNIGTEKYTVTLRRSPKSPYRNSDPLVWRTFAKEIGAMIIEDYYDVPIDLHDRLALYAGAKMNFGLSTGPMFLITLTEYPCCAFDWGLTDPLRIRNSGIEPGQSQPWLLPNQHMLWKSATTRNLRNTWKELNRGWR